jgi:hypothetical protein
MTERDITVMELERMLPGDAMVLMELCLEQRVVPISPPILIKLVDTAMVAQRRWLTLQVRIHSDTINTIETQVGLFFITEEGRQVSNYYDGTVTATLAVDNHWRSIAQPETGYDSDEAGQLRETMPITVGPPPLRAVIGLCGGVRTRAI